MTEGTADTRSVPDDELAQEIGLNAHEYLEECFYTEVSVLDRDKFDAIPEIVKTDLTILGHLGKGSFSDVFEVVCDGLLDDELGDDVPGGQQRDPPKAKPAAPTSQAAAPGPGGLTRKRSSRRGNALSGSFSSRTLVKPSKLGAPRRVFAMKCLRPQIRADADQFTIGSEDLVHETAILANLRHDHIVRLHGRAAGHLTDAFVLNDGYFILLDKLSETLHGRMEAWRKSGCAARAPGPPRMQVARDIADAVAYLHAKRIVFRDLKPANVGFDGGGVLKLFDFGFAIGLPTQTPGAPDGLLFDRCGTPRYMAPEVGLSRGYGTPADIYSFGMLLWEICALAKPFAAIQSAKEFDRAVFLGGERPVLGGHWPKAAKALMKECWDVQPDKRPSILHVKASLTALAAGAGGKKKSAIKSLRNSMTLLRRKSDAL